MTEPSELAALRAELAVAARLAPPLWPLTSFVAVNPLRGLEHLPFDSACLEGRRWFGARTHLSLDDYRSHHRAGVIGLAELRASVVTAEPTLAAAEPMHVGGGIVDPVDLVVHDLVAGPTGADDAPPADPWVDDAIHYLGTWCTVFVDDAGAGLSMPDRHLGFFAAWRRLAAGDPRLRQLVGRRGRRWIAELPDDPVAALALALDRLRITDRVDVLRTLVTRMPGWSGHAVWADEWAPPGDTGHRVRVADLVGALAAIDAATGRRALTVVPPVPPATTDERLLEERVASAVDAASAWTGCDELGPELRSRIRALIELVPEHRRAAIWLGAHERSDRDALLSQLDRQDPGSGGGRPATQLVACIDVRSEVLRRHLERTGDHETFGFAGFFGVPVRWRPLGSERTDPRCPVLVSPRFEVAEAASGPDPAPAAVTGRAADDAVHHAKASLGAPFALAESAGWLLGPVAAARTLAPRLARRWSRGPRAATAPAVAAEEHDTSGLPLDQRVLFAEAIVATIGFRQFAPLVVLCGHGSRTTNNPHASALDCGACGGAPGGANARIASAILNDPAVRAQLGLRGIVIPADTWFVAAQHDTASDRVEILDPVPAPWSSAVAALERDLAVAGERAAAERAIRLPGDARRVRHRGEDWAETRPEWGLAGNMAFVVGPRSITRDVDLGGRVFLHSYDAATDPDGVALENILTAPLVVAQWISAQYYFSTVDPEVFGAGDKMLHNPVGGVGVLRGQAGDLAVGLPVQSVAVGDRLEHHPLRLLAVVQAPLEQIEAIIARNGGLRTLVEHEWIHVAGRSHGHEPWSLRSPSGTWTTWYPASAMTPSATLEDVGAR